jgi:serine/threonine-protein kinase
MSPPGDKTPHDEAPHDGYRPGDLIAGKYSLLCVLGEGGMGSVWSAKNIVLDLDVALKLIRGDMGTSETALRLLREARATALLGHRSIVRVFDFGTTEKGDPFLVMEILEGVSLASILDNQRRLPATEAVRTLLPIADALAAAHARGILHCDVKPDNIVLVPDGPTCAVPKLVDFGIAKFVRRSGDGSDGCPPISLRSATLEACRPPGAPPRAADRTVAGTPDYMSPEQAQGLELDQRTDIWSLAILLYEAITGARPFLNDDVHAQLMSICSDPLPPLSAYHVYDDALWSILQRALEKDRALRFETMMAFGTALASWAVSVGVETDVTGTSLAERWLQVRRTPVSMLPAAELHPAQDIEEIIDLSELEDGGCELAASPPPDPPAAPSPALREPETTLPLPLVVRSHASAEAPPERAGSGNPSLEQWLTRDITPRAAREGSAQADAGDDPVLDRWLSRESTPAAAIELPPRRRTGRRPRRLFRWRTAAVVAAAAALYAGHQPLLRAVGERLHLSGASQQMIGSTAILGATEGEPALATTAAAEVPPRQLADETRPRPAEPTTAASTAATTAASSHASPTACIASMLPADAFGTTPDLGFICKEADPRRNAAALASALVQHGAAPTTQAMREWALLHWYELALVEVARARCCAGAEPTKLPAPIGRCEPFSTILPELGAAASEPTASGAPTPATEAALARFTRSVHCTVTGGSLGYRYRDRPRGGEESAFRRFLAR